MVALPATEPRSASQRLRKYQDRRVAAVEEMDALRAKAETEERDLTEEENSAFESRKAEVEKLDGSIATEEWLIQQRAKQASAISLPLGQGQPSDRQSFPSPNVNYRAWGPSKVFTGENADEDAYTCGKWCRAVLWGDKTAAKWCEERGIEARTQIETTNSAGGILVPEQFLAQVITLVEQYGTFRRKARLLPMAGDTLRIPRRKSGVTAYWVGEETATTESQMVLDAVELVARDLSALTLISEDLAEDAVVSIADLVAREMAYAFAVKEDQCGFLGTGTSTYGHIVGLITACAAATATVSTAAAGNTAFATLDLVDFEEMVGMLPEFPGISPEWYISKVGWAASMLRLADAAGGVTAAEITAGGALRPMFLGHPVNFIQCMNTTTSAQTSTNGLCYFGDLRMAACFGNRRGIGVKVLNERYAEYRQIGMIATERLAINVHDVGDTSSAGAMIMMATPSS